MDITHLRTFLEVSRTRHFGRAAEHLFVTQSAVSARIKLLEQQLGLPLFERKRNDLQLTPAGDKLLRHADTIVKGWDRARIEVAMDEEYDQALVVGGMYDLWHILLDTWVAQVRDNLPAIGLTLEAHTGHDLTLRIANHELDLGFVFEPVHAPEIESQSIANTRLLLVASEPQPSADEAMANDYIHVDWGTRFATQFADAYPDFNAPSLRVNLGHMALDILKTRGGAAYMAEGMVAQALEDGDLFRVENARVFKRQIHAIYHSQSRRLKSIEQVLELEPF